jgi:DDE superfamily endonuclease
LLHFVGQSAWSDAEVLAKVGEMVLPKIEHHGAIEAWIIDDTGFPKKGEHSVGVARQYCGRLGKTDNCQVAVSLSLANHHASLPVAYRLYLPEEWSNDRKRLRKVGVPEDVGFKTKPEIALALERSPPPSAQRSCVRRASSDPRNNPVADLHDPRARSPSKDPRHKPQIAIHSHPKLVRPSPHPVT